MNEDWRDSLNIRNVIIWKVFSKATFCKSTLCSLIWSHSPKASLIIQSYLIIESFCLNHLIYGGLILKRSSNFWAFKMNYLGCLGWLNEKSYAFLHQNKIIKKTAWDKVWLSLQFSSISIFILLVTGENQIGFNTELCASHLFRPFLPSAYAFTLQ